MGDDSKCTAQKQNARTSTGIERNAIRQNKKVKEKPFKEDENGKMEKMKG